MNRRLLDYYRKAATCGALQDPTVVKLLRTLNHPLPDPVVEGHLKELFEIYGLFVRPHTDPFAFPATEFEGEVRLGWIM